MLDAAINRHEYIKRFLCEKKERTVLGAAPARFRSQSLLRGPEKPP